MRNPDAELPPQPAAAAGKSAANRCDPAAEARDPAAEARDPAAEARRAAALLRELQQQMNRLQREIRIAIQAQLRQMAGSSLGSLSANRELTDSIQTMLDSHGLRVRCPHCGEASILRVSPRAGASAGVFVFDHTVNGKRTFHGGRTSLPEILLVAKPRRRKAKSKHGSKPDAGELGNRAAG